MNTIHKHGTGEEEKRQNMILHPQKNITHKYRFSTFESTVNFDIKIYLITSNPLQRRLYTHRRAVSNFSFFIIKTPFKVNECVSTIK